MSEEKDEPDKDIPPPEYDKYDNSAPPPQDRDKQKEENSDS